MEKVIKYEDALRELEQIVRLMESDELDIDQMGERLKRAQQLIRLCKDRLTKTDEEIKAILADSDTHHPSPNTHHPSPNTHHPSPIT